MTNKYSVLIGLEKSVFRTMAIAGPVLIEVLPATWMNITFGGLILLAINYAKNRNIEEVEDAVSQS